MVVWGWGIPMGFASLNVVTRENNMVGLSLRLFAAVLALMLLSGCGTQTRVQPTYTSIGSAYSSPSCSDTAELSFTRSGDFMYMALSAVVKVDGVEIGRLSRNQQFTQVVCAGNRSIKIEASMNPGSSVISGNFVSNGVYKFLIGPNSSSFMTGAIQLSAISGTSSNSGLFGINLTESSVPKVEAKLQKQTTATPATKTKMDLRTAKTECSAIGFKLGTDKHAECVLELVK